MKYNNTYTVGGNRTSVVNDINAIQSADWTQTYSYDTKDQLTAENTTRTGGTNYMIQ